MSRFTLFCLSITAIAGIANGDETKSGAGPEQKLAIAIQCKDGTCVADPPELKYWPNEIVVGSKEKWTCTVNDQQPCDSVLPAGTKVAFLVLRSKDDADGHFVILPLVDPKQDSLGPLPLAAMAAAVIACLSAALVMCLTWSSTKIRERQAIEMSDRTAGLAGVFQTVAETLRFPAPPELPPVRNYSPQLQSRQPEAPRVDPEVEAVKMEIGRFITCVKDWYVALGRAAPAVEQSLGELKALYLQVGRQVGAEFARVTYKGATKTMARLALSATDDDLNQSGRRNAMAEAALQSLLASAGFQLLVPNEYDRYSDRWHAIGHNVRTEDGSKRESVARVERRGLFDPNSNEVIQRAVVAIYD